jgi:hypothetical protein
VIGSDVRFSAAVDGEAVIEEADRDVPMDNPDTVLNRVSGRPCA